MSALIPLERIERRIYLLRGMKVMLDRDLAELYGVKTKNLNKAARRNLKRFPADFMFQLTKEEALASRFQIGTLKRGQNIKYLPYAFTQDGVAMLSSVLKSEKAIQVNIQIMRTFTRLREFLSSQKDLALKLQELEKRCDAQFKIVFDAIKEIMAPPEKPTRRIGFQPQAGA